MFILKEIWFKNFRSWKNLHLKDIDNLGLTLISGSNGSGKSSIRLAIEHLLSDTTSENIPAGELTFNREGNCELGCVIQQDDNEIKIVKYREHKEHINKILLSVNGDDSHTESNRKDTQKNVDKLLGSNKDILGISTIFSQNSPSFPESKESERKKIIYDALDLHKYNMYCTNAKDKILDLKNDIDNKEMKLKYIKDNIEEVKEKIINLKGKKDGWNINQELKVEQVLREIKEIEQENVESEVQELQTKRSVAEKYIKKCEKKISKLEDKKVEIDEGNYKTWKASLDELKNKIILTKREIEDIEETISNSKDGMCPILNTYCDKLQDDTTAKKELEIELKGWKTDEYELQKMKVEIEDEIETIEHSVIYNEEINEEIDSYKTGISSTEREIQYTETSIERLKYKEEDKRRRIDGCNDKIKEIWEETNPFVGVLKDEKRGIKNKKKEVTELGVTIDKLYDSLKYYEFWKRGYGKSGIPNLRAEAFLESIEIETNNVLSKISDQLYVEIESQSLTKTGDVREKVGYKVHHPEKSVHDYWSYSGGQRQRIQIADKIAFNNLLGKFDFLFLDEVLEISLDEVGKENVLNLLREKSSELGALFVISHDESIKDGFDNILNIENKDGESRIV